MHSQETADVREVLELRAYDAFAERSAIIRRLQAALGPDLELTIAEADSGLLDLHEALLQQTQACIEIALALRGLRVETNAT